MGKIKVEAKNLEEAKNIICEKLNANQDEIIILNHLEKKSFLSKKVEVEAITKADFNKFIKETINKVLVGIGADFNLEVSTKNDIPYYNIITSNAILIGKNGRTIDAIQIVVNNIINNEIHSQYRIVIDVNGYKTKREVRLQKLAKYTAREVAKTKISVKLDPMNSYERRIIHTTLAESTDICTESVGEEPNRCVVIKVKED